MHKWIFVGSLGAVFLVTLGFSYGPGYGGSLLAFLGNNITGSPEMSPSDMVTPVVTSKKVVTSKSVTNVTSVSPLVSPLIHNDNQPYLISPVVSPMTSSIPTMSPSPTVSPLSSPTATPPPATPSSTPIPVSPQSAKININTAGLSELDKLPEIGLTRAQYIIDYRFANGPFQTIEDIMNVKDIKTARFEKIKDQIKVGP